jgi:hypothetical protein
LFGAEAHRPVGSAAHACAQAKALDEHLAEERLRSQRALADKDQQLRAAEVRCRSAAVLGGAGGSCEDCCVRARTDLVAVVAGARQGKLIELRTSQQRTAAELAKTTAEAARLQVMIDQLSREYYEYYCVPVVAFEYRRASPSTR